jgi:hypothetical protein
MDELCPTNPYSKSTNTQPTPLGNIYFSHENVDHIRTQTVKDLFEQYGLKISPQPYCSTETFMLKIYGDVIYDMNQYDTTECSLAILNNYTMKHLLRRIVLNIKQQTEYLHNQDDVINGVIKVPRPEYTRTSKTLNLYKYLP